MAGNSNFRGIFLKITVIVIMKFNLKINKIKIECKIV